MPRRRRAMASSSRIFGSGADWSWIESPSRASLSRSMGSRSGMFATYPRPQALQAAKLQLLDRAFAAPQHLRDFTSALLLHETKLQDSALVFRQFPHQG